MTGQPAALAAPSSAIAAGPKRPGVARRFLAQPVAVAALAYVACLVVFAVFADLLAPYDPSLSDMSSRFLGPSPEHWLGTDDLGRDVLSRAIFGARIALGAGAQAVLLAIAVGVPVGLFIGYRAGAWDWATMRIADLEQAIPMLLLAFTFLAIIGNGLPTAMLAVAVGFAFSYIRIVRAVVLAERERLYVDAARVQGFGTGRVLFSQILPNAFAPIVVQTSLLLGVALLIEAMLSFLGLGVDPSEPTWGGMLRTAQVHQLNHPAMSLVPGLAITLAVLAFNLVGDGVRDALSPRMPETAAKRARVRRAPGQAPPAPSQGGVDSHDGDGAVIRLRDVSVAFPGRDGQETSVLSEIGFDVRPGEIFGLVGESGSGKSMTAQAIAGMITAPGYVSSGSIALNGRELTTLSPKEWERIRGKDIGLLFQDALAALSPVHTIGMQITESIRAHDRGISKRAARARAIALLERVKVTNAAARMKQYPHEFSGGMAQRALIAAALITRPQLLIADEPTTALDVTVQKQVLELIRELRDEFAMSVIFITHDLGVVAEICDRVGVMYAGELVEVGDVRDVIERPRHPYTSALVRAMPEAGSERRARLTTIPGSVPPPWALPQGCRFSPRCEFATAECTQVRPRLEDGVRCLRVAELTLEGAR